MCVFCVCVCVYVCVCVCSWYPDSVQRLGTSSREEEEGWLRGLVAVAAYERNKGDSARDFSWKLIFYHQHRVKLIVGRTSAEQVGTVVV